MKILGDNDSEQAVLSVILKNGYTSFAEIAGLEIKPTTFHFVDNRVLYHCIEEIYSTHEDIKLDIALLKNAAKKIKYEHWFNEEQNLEYVSKLQELPIEESNLTKFASKIRKLEIARNIYEGLEKTKTDLSKVTGDEPIVDIFGKVENAIFNITGNISSDAEAPELLNNELDDHIKLLESGNGDCIGLSTGFPRWDHYIGGGLRKGTVNVMGARSGVGKSLFLNQVGMYVAGTLNLPVLYMDTEMRRSEQINRCLAAQSSVPIQNIENGKFSHNFQDSKAVRDAAKMMADWPYYHKSIAGKAFDAQLAIMRKWLVKHVGLNLDGKAKPCLILYDYIKLMSDDGLKSVQEYQLIGFMMSELHNFAVKYGIPILSAVQLNRDGLNKEDASALSQSDRILWLCTTMSILKDKSDEEIATEQNQHGSQKIIVLKARFGAGLKSGDYINCYANKQCCSLSEGVTKYESLKGVTLQDFESSDDAETTLF